MDYKEQKKLPNGKVRKGRIAKITGIIGCIGLLTAGTLVRDRRWKKEELVEAEAKSEIEQQSPLMKTEQVSMETNITSIEDSSDLKISNDCCMNHDAKEGATKPKPIVTEPKSEETSQKTQSIDEFNYTGYLDELPVYCELLEQIDLDGDGIAERMYKESDKDKDCSMYLYFSKGEKLMLAKECWGRYFDVKYADLTGNGQLEIIFSQYTFSTAGVPEGIAVYHNTKDGYEYMPLLYQGEDGMVGIPVRKTRKEDYNILVEQPDTNYERTYEFDGLDVNYCDVDSIGHLWFADLDGQMIQNMGEDVQIVDSDTQNKKNLQFTAYLGDKWCENTITWELEYVDSAWIIKKVLAL